MIPRRSRNLIFKFSFFCLAVYVLSLLRDSNSEAQKLKLDEAENKEMSDNSIEQKVIADDDKDSHVINKDKNSEREKEDINKDINLVAEPPKARDELNHEKNIPAVKPDMRNDVGEEDEKKNDAVEKKRRK